MDVLKIQVTCEENRKPAGQSYGSRPRCPHANAEVVTRIIHPGSIFAESGPDWEDLLYCPDCGQPIYDAHRAVDPRDNPSEEIPF